VPYDIHRIDPESNYSSDLPVDYAEVISADNDSLYDTVRMAQSYSTECAHAIYRVVSEPLGRGVAEFQRGIRVQVPMYKEENLS